MQGTAELRSLPSVWGYASTPTHRNWSLYSSGALWDLQKLEMFNEQLCRQSLNATPSIVHCECRKDHYYDDATRQCQNANKDSVVAHILYWLVFLPIAFAGLVIATRLYRKKLLGFRKRNKEGNRRPSSFKSGIKHYCCANKAV